MPQSISLGFQIVCASGKNRYRRLRQQGRVNQKSPQDLKLEHIRRHREYLDKVQHEQEEEEEEEEEDAAHNHRLREVVNELKEHSAAAAATIDVAEQQEPEIMGTPYDTTTGSAVPLPGSDEETMRKSKILMEIMNAGAAVEEVVETFRDEIDHVMLELLEARIKTARQLEQDEETVQGMIVLYRYLKSEYDRNAASPALRLLDTLLQLMNDSDDNEQSFDGTSMAYDRREEMKQKVMARMQMAFDASLPLQNDVVSVAQQLASGKQRFIDEIVNESVKPLEFIYEVEALLEKAVDQQRVLEEHISKEDQGDVKHQLQKAFDARSETIDNVQEIVSMARMVSNRSRIE
mmetsp:Transcript_3251/g.6523  ORF Transcript_3251/g.6523 Transcript_3251/m.6523 type:complete len:348 (+) Transcript_3251:216-1259(+)